MDQVRVSRPTHLLLAVAAVATFGGHAYEYLCFDSPLRVLLWDEGLLSGGLARLAGVAWADYLADARAPALVAGVTVATGLLWAAAAVACACSLRSPSRWTRVTVAAGWGALLIHAALVTRDHFSHLAQLLEFGIQLAAPPLLLVASVRGIGAEASGRLRRGGLVAVAVTFAAHGLYAVGVYPVPGHFVDLTLAILGGGEAAARTFLLVVGALDLLLLPLLLARATRAYALAYATAWGLLTAAARAVAGFDADFPAATLHRHLFATVFRLGHGLLPLALLTWGWAGAAPDGIRSAGWAWRRPSRVLAKAALPSVLLASLLTLAGGAHAKTARYRLVLADDPSTTATVAWDQVSGAGALLFYGTEDHGTRTAEYPSRALATRVTMYRGMRNHFVRLRGLRPNTTYYFVVRDSEGLGRRYSFRTAPARAARLSLIAGGDSRNHRDVRRRANALVAKLRPHAVLFGGDMTNGDTDEEWRAWFDDWALTTTPEGHLTPIVPVRGNHEAPATIYELFDTPTADSYYGLTWAGGMLRTYALNSEISVLGDQLEWLRDDLATHADATHKVAQYHKPMRPHSSSKRENDRLYSAWAEVFYEGGVRLVIDSDSHLAKTTYPVAPSSARGNDEGFVVDEARGTVYTGEGSWGAPLRPADDPKSWTRALGSFNQFKLLFVSPDRIEQRTVRFDNEAEVASVPADDPFALPAGLDLWRPATGAVVEIYPVGQTSRPCAPAGAPCSRRADAVGEAFTGEGYADGGCGCAELPPAGTEVAAMADGRDDAAEAASGGRVDVDGPVVHLGARAGASSADGRQVVGLRFPDVALSAGDTVREAYLVFVAAERSVGAADLEIAGERVGSAAPFDATPAGRPSGRARTTRSVRWADVPPWEGVGEAGVAQRSPDLSAVITELIAQPTWRSGNAIALLIEGTGERAGQSADAGLGVAPRLVLRVSRGADPVSASEPGAAAGEVEVFPLPARDLLWVRGAAEVRSVGLYTAAGTEARRWVGSGPYPLGGLPPGHYVAVVEGVGGRRSRHRVVVR